MVDVYQTVTNKIIAQLEGGVSPWSKPWTETGSANIARPLRSNGIAYRGINVLILWATAAERGYTNQTWMTYKQAGELGGQVRKGEKGTMVVFFKPMTVADATAKDGEKDIPVLRNFTVFNVEQIDGLPARFYATAPTVVDVNARNDAAEAFFAKAGAIVNHGGNKAFYMPSTDLIQMPAFAQFKDAASYYATLGHEHIHWTRHASRLNRDFGQTRFGDEGYAVEELVAEIGTAFLCADLGISVEPRADHASYIASWLKVLKGDKKAIFTAAGHAERAAGFMHGCQEEEEEELAQAA